MRLARDLRTPLTPALALLAGALFFGGGEGDSSLPWLGAAAVVLALALLAVKRPPQGLVVFLPLIALGLWCAASVEWSIEPDRSWSYANRALVYAAFALVGGLLAVEPRRLFYGVSGLLGAVCVWALLGKVIPALYEDYGRIARLRGPVGYWNSLALLGDVALPLGLCLATRRRVLGALLVYGWLVAIGMTYSRGGVIVAVIVIAAWIALSGAWIEAVATLLAAGLPAAGVVAVAYSLPALTSDGQPHAARLRDGLVFGAVLLVDAAIAAMLARFPPPVAVSPLLRRAALVALTLVCVAALVVGGLHARRWWDSFTSTTAAELPNSPARLTEAGSNFRWSWWQEAWHAFRLNPAKGTGAGTFQLTDERYRTNDLGEPTEPHNLPLQFLSETGIIGALLFVASMAWLIVSGRRRPGPQLALALALPAFLLHSLIDIDWDFAAVAAPVLLIAGALATRPATRRRVSFFTVLGAGGIGFALVSSLFVIWLANRWTNEANLTTNTAQALQLVQRARSLDPLSIQPLLAGGAAESAAAQSGSLASQKHHLELALGFFKKATQVQPLNAQGWYELGFFNLVLNRCPRAALPDLSRATVLDGQNAENRWYAQALREVNSGRYLC
jgi:hypothetical protein